MQITDLSPQKNNPKRFNLFLDGKFALGVDVDTLVKEGLRIGKTLTEEEWNKLNEEVNKTALYNNALVFLSYRPRSESEVREHIKSKSAHKGNKEIKPQKISSSIFDDIMNKLKILGLIDDEKFCLWWIEQRNTFRPKGKRLLELELLKKGISKDVIKTVMADQETGKTEKDTSLILGEKWLTKHHVSLTNPLDKDRLFRFLASRGFDFTVVQDTIDTLKKKA